MGNLSNDKLVQLLLYGSELYGLEINREIIKLTIKFLKSSKPFERPLPGADADFKLDFGRIMLCKLRLSSFLNILA